MKRTITYAGQYYNQVDVVFIYRRGGYQCWILFYSIVMCRMRRFLAVLRSFFHSSLLCIFSFHPSPPTILPSSLISSCHLLVGLPLNLVVSKFTYIIPFWEFYFLPFSVHAQTNVIYLTLMSLLHDSNKSTNKVPDHDQQRSNRHAPTAKPEAPSAVVRSWWWAERHPKHVEPHINVK